MHIVHCSHCGKEIDDSFKFCPECGNPISIDTPAEAEEISEQKSEAVTDTLSGPTTSQQTLSQRKSPWISKKAFIGVTASVIIIVAIWIIIREFVYPPKTTSTSDDLAFLLVKIEKDVFEKSLNDYTCSYDEEEDVYRYSFGIEENTETFLVASHDKLDNAVKELNKSLKELFTKIGYLNTSIESTIYSSDRAVVLKFKDNRQTYCLTEKASDQLNSSHSSVGASTPSSGIYGKYITPDRSREAWVCATKYVEDNLKSPSTAKFCKYTEATITRVGEDEYVIHGYVDAQNSFGATVRQEWTVSLSLTARGFRDPYIEFG